MILALEDGPGARTIGTVRTLTSADLPASAALHRRVFHDAAISRLGQEAAWRYHAHLLSQVPDAIAHGMFAEGKLVGFCFGGHPHEVEGVFLRRNLWFVAGCMVRRPTVLGHASFRGRLRDGWRFLAPRRQESPPVPDEKTEAPPSLTIFYVAVAKAWRGQGIARALLDESERVARQRGMVRLDLNVHPTNHGAVEAYERLGWQRQGPARDWQGNMFKPLG